MVGTFLFGGFRIEVSHGGKNGLAVEHVPVSRPLWILIFRLGWRVGGQTIENPKSLQTGGEELKIMMPMIQDAPLPKTNSPSQAIKHHLAIHI